MVRFSVKPGDETDETESANLVNKTGLGKRRVPRYTWFLPAYFRLLL